MSDNKVNKNGWQNDALADLEGRQSECAIDAGKPKSEWPTEGQLDAILQSEEKNNALTEDDMEFKGTDRILSKIKAGMKNNGSIQDVSQNSREYSRKASNEAGKEDEAIIFLESGKTEKSRIIGKRKKKTRYLIAALAAVLIFGTAISANKGFWHLTDPGTYQGSIEKVQETRHYTLEDAENESTGGEYSTVAAKPEASENQENSGTDMTEASQTGDAQTEASQTGDIQTSQSSYTDTYFIRTAKEVLDLISEGLSLELDSRDVLVTYIYNEWYQREEACVSFSMDGEDAQVSFDRNDGYLLHIDFWQGEGDLSQGIPMSDPEALEAARDWYEKLPFEPGYEYTTVSKFDDHAWSYDFSKTVEINVDGEPITLHNAYETARITIDPTNGRLTLATGFYVPLLNDHAKTDPVIAEEEALIKALSYLGLSQDIMDDPAYKVSSKLSIVLPRYETVSDRGSTAGITTGDGTGSAEGSIVGDETGTIAGSTDGDGTVEGSSAGDEPTSVAEGSTDNTVIAEEPVDYHFSSVTRLAWMVTIEHNIDLIDSAKIVSVDLYTGEILCVDEY